METTQPVKAALCCGYVTNTLMIMKLRIHNMRFFLETLSCWTWGSSGYLHSQLSTASRWCRVTVQLCLPNLSQLLLLIHLSILQSFIIQSRSSKSLRHTIGVYIFRWEKPAKTRQEKLLRFYLICLNYNVALHPHNRMQESRPRLGSKK